MTNTLPIDDNGSPSKAAPKEGRYDVGGYSDAGRRRATNEDCYLIASFHRSLHVIDSNVQTRQVGWSPGPLFGTLLMVADGMGGHSGGDIASQSAVAAVADYLTNVLPGATTMVESLPQDARSSLHGLRARLSSALLVGDEAVRAQSANTLARDMGTTLTMAFITWPALYVAHVGDSRCYLLRGGKLKQLTNDHTVANQIAQTGVATFEESAQLNHILWNCLGGGDDSRPTPEVIKVELNRHDAVFLCTDGLTNELSEDEISEVLAQRASSEQLCTRLVELANRHGGEDNITAILAKPQTQAANPD